MLMKGDAATYATLLAAVEELLRAERHLQRAQSAYERAEWRRPMFSCWDGIGDTNCFTSRVHRAIAHRERAETRIEQLCAQLGIRPHDGIPQ